MRNRISPWTAGRPARATSRDRPRDVTAPDDAARTLTESGDRPVGDKPIFAYIAGLPQPQRGIVEAGDALAAKTLPDLQRSVKWGMAYYGVGDGWCFSCGGFAGHVKLMFINGAALERDLRIVLFGVTLNVFVAG
ncbi:DUF1801 domain-containing protein [Arthrobacter sp. CAN_C5]|uniref:DUF1801 domain-containing protein n=1 Tax=Arthrobacter sp. CAN_C5 TaxID=2760706 RepID=UPI001AEA3644|nr:DUF1801 domain-containing protein [Arthrobacter sp. CAN_C5]MBP2217015.1 hypothetical protein [Arthrobacter sp. CAN_C5]